MPDDKPTESKRPLAANLVTTILLLLVAWLAARDWISPSTEQTAKELIPVAVDAAFDAAEKLRETDAPAVVVADGGTGASTEVIPDSNPGPLVTAAEAVNESPEKPEANTLEVAEPEPTRCIGDVVRVSPFAHGETVAHLPTEAWYRTGTVTEGPHDSGWWVNFGETSRYGNVVAWVPGSFLIDAATPIPQVPTPEPEPVHPLVPAPLPVEPVAPQPVSPVVPTPAPVETESEAAWEVLAEAVESGELPTFERLRAVVDRAAGRELPDVRRIDSLPKAGPITDRASVAATLRGVAPSPTTPRPQAKPFPSDVLRVVFIIEKTGVQPEHVRDVKLHLIDNGIEYCDLDDDLTPGDLANAESWVRDAYEARGESSPWLLISNTEGGFSGPLPATAAEILSLIESIELSACR